MKYINLIIKTLKKSVFFISAIAVIFLIACLLWFLTSSVRAEFLMRGVNRISSHITDESMPHMFSTVPSRELTGNAARLGSWYYTDASAENRALIFTLFAQGSFFPCMAVVDSERTVENIIPLGIHAETMFMRIPEGIVNFHKKRIEEALK